MPYISIILTVAFIHFVALVSPGPDFMMITRNSLIYSRKTVIYSAIGLAVGLLVHVAYCLVGIGFLIVNSPVLFDFIKFFGAAYLIYIGLRSIRSKSNPVELNGYLSRRELSKWAALRIGFVTDATNPKATLFFLSLFTLVITPSTPLFVKLFMGAEMSVATALWFTLLAYILTHRLIKERIDRIQNYAEKTAGVALIGLGLKVVLYTRG